MIMMNLKEQPNLGVATLLAYFTELRDDDLLYHFDGSYEEISEIFNLDIFDRDQLLANHEYMMRTFGYDKHGCSNLWRVIENNECLGNILGVL